MALSRRPGKYGRAGAARQRGKRQPLQAPRGAFVLTMIDGQNEGKEFYFEQRASLGRVEENDIVLIEPGISRTHAVVRYDHGVHLVEDLESANGTRLNGDKLGREPEVLRDGDYLTLAGCTLQFSTIESLKGEATAERLLTGEKAKGVDLTGEEAGRSRPFRSRRIKLLLAATGLAVVGLLIWRLLPRETIDTMFDQSNVPVRYSDDDSFLNTVFGFGEWDRSHRNRVLIQFTYLGGRVTLQYGAWGIDKVGEVAIALNGEKVGEVPLTLDRWVYGLKLVLPADKLRQGTNELVFDNTRNPPGRDPWEICYVQLLQEAIPPPDLQEARNRFELAKNAWDEREIEPGNLYEALVQFRQARNFMERLTERPDLYQEAVDHIDKIDRLLTKRFEEGVFSARRAAKVDGDPAKVRGALTRALRYFRKGDFRYRKLKHYLEAVSETTE